MKYNLIAALCAATVISLSSAQASIVTIDFTASDQSIVATPYVEDGFVVDGSATRSGRIQGGELTDFFVGLGDTFTFTRQDGGDFRFISFDYRSAFGGIFADGFELLGFSNGSQVADFGAFETDSGTLITETFDMGLTSIVLDELRLVGTGGSATNPFSDNFVFDTAEVPLPAAAPLFLMALAGAGLGKRRKKQLAD